MVEDVSVTERRTSDKGKDKEAKGMERGETNAGRREPWLAPRKRPLTLYFYPSLVVYSLQSVWKQYSVRRQFENPEHV